MRPPPPPRNLKRRADLLQWARDREFCGVDAASVTGQSVSSAIQLLKTMCTEGYFEEIHRGAHVYFKATGKELIEEERGTLTWGPCLLAEVWR